MARPIYQRVAVNNSGDVIPGAEFTVTNENTGTEQTIYNARSGGSVISQPAFADANGVIQFWTEPGVTYRVEATGGVGTYTDRYVEADTRMTDLSDPNSGSLMPPGAFGLGGAAILSSTLPSDDLDTINKTGFYQTNGAVTLNVPVTISGMVCHTEVIGGFASQMYICYGGSIAANLNRVFIRHKDNGVWEVWHELYHTGNLNQFEFGGAGSGDLVAVGYVRSSSSVQFILPISLFANPTSVTVVNTFKIVDATFSDLITGLDSGDFSLGSERSWRNMVLTVSGLSGLTPKETVLLIAESAGSKITVNP